MLKICGMKDPEQILQIQKEFTPDFMGFIFYPKSPRYVGENPEIPDFSGTNTMKVGVFVKESIESILRKVEACKLDYVQLHSDESASYVSELKKRNIKTIKVFRVDEEFDFETVSEFEGLADYFLFDAKVSSYGGEGKAFDWKILENYKGKTPWLLSGGLNISNIAEIEKYSFNSKIGIDINSGFEVSPGVKDIEKLKKLKDNVLL